MPELLNTPTVPTAHEAGEVHPESPLRLFLSFPFGSDEAYQAGLASILAAADGKIDQEKEDLRLRSQVFYFNRVTGNSLTVEEAQASRAAVHSTSSVTTSVQPSAHQETPNLTFAQLKELIEQGKTDMIPNNKQIPDVVNNAPPSQSMAVPRKKPWEVTSQGVPDA